MSLKKRGGYYQWHEWIDGVEYRESMRTPDRNEAKRRRQDRITEIKSGRASKLSRQCFEVALEAYLERRKLEVASKTYATDKHCGKALKRFFKDTPLRRITADRISDYQADRKRQKVNDREIGNRTVNLEIGLIRRILKKHKLWMRIADDVKELPEESNVGRALEVDEQKRLLDLASTKSAWMGVYCAAVLALNTTMRSIEIKQLQWGRVDMFGKTLRVSRKTTKTDAGDRVIPLNRDAIWALGKMWERALSYSKDSKDIKPEHYVFCGFEHWEYKPKQPVKTWRTAWRSLRKAAKLPGLRFHDLRHSAITVLAESGQGDQVIKSIAGHVSQQMLEHYSHIRMQAKRTAMEALSGKDTLPDPTVTAKEAAEKQVTIN